MTPAERQLVTDLFDRLATLEDAQRDPEAERLIRDGHRQAPNAVYALVQTTLVQDEALKRANARIQELEAELGIGNEPPRQGGGFLDSVRNSIFGRRDDQRGSVPTVKPGDGPTGGPWAGRQGAAPPAYGDRPMGAPPGYGGSGAPGYGGGPGYGGTGYGGPGSQPMQPEPQRGGGSFLGTAAAAAAGVIGGSLLLNSIRGMMGNNPGGNPGGHGITDPAAAGGGNTNPWGATGGGNDDLGRQLGRDDIGRSGQGAFGDQQQGASGDQQQGLFHGNDAAPDVQGDNISEEAIEDSDFGLDDSGGDFEGGGDSND